MTIASRWCELAQHINLLSTDQSRRDSILNAIGEHLIDTLIPGAVHHSHKLALQECNRSLVSTDGHAPEVIFES